MMEENATIAGTEEIEKLVINVLFIQSGSPGGFGAKICDQQ